MKITQFFISPSPVTFFSLVHWQSLHPVTASLRASAGTGICQKKKPVVTSPFPERLALPEWDWMNYSAVLEKMFTSSSPISHATCYAQHPTCADIVFYRWLVLISTQVLFYLMVPLRYRAIWTVRIAGVYVQLSTVMHSTLGESELFQLLVFLKNTVKQSMLWGTINDCPSCL